MLERSGMWTSRLDTPALSSPVSDTEQFCTLRSHPPWYNEVSLAGEAEARRVDSVTSVSSCGLISGHTSCSLEIGGVTPALGYVAFDEEKTNAKIDEMLGKHSAAQGERLSTTQAVFNKVRRLLPQSWPQRSRSASAEPRGVHTTAACPAAVNAPDGQENKTSRRLFQVEVQTPPRLRVGTVLPAAVPGTTTTVPSPTSTRRPRSDRVEEFHRALDNEPVRLAFGRFCKKTLSSENVEFVRKVRELKKRASLEETTARELREMLSTVADEFVRPEAPTEVNVKGSTRNHVLVAIQAALEAGKGKTGGNVGGARRERVLALNATVALVDLAREIHALIVDGLWPRFLVSSEFTLLMNTEEMRIIGFTDLDGKVLVSALPPQHPRRPSKKREESPSTVPSNKLGRGRQLRSTRSASSAAWSSFVSASSSSSAPSSPDVVGAATAAAAVAGSARPPRGARRSCGTTFRWAPGRQQGRFSGTGHNVFEGLPSRWGGGSKRNNKASSASTSTSPTKSYFQGNANSTGVSASSLRRAFSLR